MSTVIGPCSTVETSAIRTYFPALERKHKGYPVAYFDGPGGTQVPRMVVESINEYLYYHNANTHWAYPTSEETDLAIEAGRVACADLLNASANEIVFGANMTSLTFHLSRALAPTFQPEDEIVVTELDHHANVAPWHRLSTERGIVIRKVRMDPNTGQLDWNSFHESLGSKTRLVAMGAASNALGTVNDVERAIKAAHELGALAFVDAVHYAPHALVDVRSWDCDFLAISPYKFYGPHLGVLFAKYNLLSVLDFPKLIPAPDYPPENAETGTQNQEGIVGTAAAIDFLASLSGGDTRRERLALSYRELHARSSELTRMLWNGLGDIARVRLYGPAPSEPRTATVAFTIEGVASTEAARRLAEKGLFLSHGDFYAATVVERLGLGSEGLLRAGCSCYTNQEEIERLISEVTNL
ncbi:MAG TPA: cysteine desulfurase-like protein [Pyrinomonadaceae bacterium]|nr:cysteine desulfurase-like protein [Pyrinomonadaceae bacterium]